MNSYLVLQHETQDIWHFVYLTMKKKHFDKFLIITRQMSCSFGVLLPSIQRLGIFCYRIVEFYVVSMPQLPGYLNCVDLWRFSAVLLPSPLTHPPSPAVQGIAFQTLRVTHDIYWHIHHPALITTSNGLSNNQFLRSRQLLRSVVTRNPPQLWSSCCWRDLHAVLVLGRTNPLSLASSWLICREHFLKGPFMTFIADLWGLWVCKYAVHSSNIFQQ